ncbi:MAG: SDR family oxidoreductase [Hyphomicrobiaceae bacterium]
MSDLLCLGLGYSARMVATRLAREGWRIAGTAREAGGLDRIADAGWRALPFDAAAPSPALAAALRAATHVLVSIPPDAAGDPVLRCHGDDLRQAAGLCWIGYLSTVGVYGDHAGGWVDEATPPAPVSQRSRWRVAAEAEWLAAGAACAVPVQVFRLAGIYGPGRSAIDSLRAGTARRIVKPGQVFNRIHVEDIATTVLAGMAHPEATGLFNVTDDEPAPPQDVVAFAASLLGVPPPPEMPFETAELSPMARSFYGETKRVANGRIKRALGVTLRYPSYREGLAAIMETAGS